MRAARSCPDRLATGRAALGVMDEHLGSRRFFVAERYTIADIALYAYTHVAHEGGHDSGPTRTCARGSPASRRSRGTSASTRARALEAAEATHVLD